MAVDQGSSSSNRMGNVSRARTAKWSHMSFWIESRERRTSKLIMLPGDNRWISDFRSSRAVVWCLIIGYQNLVCSLISGNLESDLAEKIAKIPDLVLNLELTLSAECCSVWAMNCTEPAFGRICSQRADIYLNRCGTDTWSVWRSVVAHVLTVQHGRHASCAPNTRYYPLQLRTSLLSQKSAQCKNQWFK